MNLSLPRRGSMSVILLTSSKSKYWRQTSFSLPVRRRWRRRRCEFICTPLEPFKRSSTCRIPSLSLSFLLSPFLPLCRSAIRQRKARRRGGNKPLGSSRARGRDHGARRRGILFPLTLISTTQKTVATRRSLKLRIL